MGCSFVVWACPGGLAPDLPVNGSTCGQADENGQHDEQIYHG
jgi:hypothetical protein